MSRSRVPVFPNLGHFLDHLFWEDAIRLLKYQLQMKSTNRHFNTVSFFYYEKVYPEPKIQPEEYFYRRVSNNLYYGLEKEYWVIPYTIPKANLGLRKYKFFSYPMRTIYYAIGLYLTQLSQQFLYDYYSKYAKHVYSNYGGNIRFDNKTKRLILSYESFWYKPHYQAFRNRVLNVVEINPDRQVMLHLDIQNYYDDIDVSTLLNLLDEYIDPMTKQELTFDAITQGQIESFFNYVQGNRLGIPQSDNDIVSTYMGYLYLVFADLFIEEEIDRQNGVIEDYHIIRYMDDYYISLIFVNGISQFEKEKYVNIISGHIADMLYQQLGLRLNTKTKLYWLKEVDEKLDLLKNLKRVSPGYEEEDDGTEKPQKKLRKIFDQLKKLKKSSLDKSFNLRKDLDTETLKDIYVDAVQSLMAKPSNIKKLDELFDGFNFDLVNAHPREIVIILLFSESATKAFHEYLLRKDRLSSADAFLILTFLCQTNFESSDLIDKIKIFNPFCPIMEAFELGNLQSEFPGYFELSESQTLKLCDWGNVIEQVRLRIFAEQRQQYSVALSHLLNEIQSIVWQLDDKTIDESSYKAPHVLAYLNKRRVNHKICTKIRNLFVRRNKTPVSHADTASWHVSKLEYEGYRKQVGECLKCIL